jgi:DNA-binding response OmpR family regulator
MTGKQKRILIVDDEEVIRRLLHHKLSSEAYQCREAGDAEQPLDELETNPTGLLILLTSKGLLSIENWGWTLPMVFLA